MSIEPRFVLSAWNECLWLWLLRPLWLRLWRRFWLVLRLLATLILTATVTIANPQARGILAGRSVLLVTVTHCGEPILHPAAQHLTRSGNHSRLPAAKASTTAVDISMTLSSLMAVFHRPPCCRCRSRA